MDARDQWERFKRHDFPGTQIVEDASGIAFIQRNAIKYKSIQKTGMIAFFMAISPAIVLMITAGVEGLVVGFGLSLVTAIPATLWYMRQMKKLSTAEAKVRITATGVEVSKPYYEAFVKHADLTDITPRTEGHVKGYAIVFWDGPLVLQPTIFANSTEEATGMVAALKAAIAVTRQDAAPAPSPEAAVPAGT